MNTTNLTSAQVISLLKKSTGNYIHHYLQCITIYNDEADEIGRCSNKVLNNLIDSGKVKKVGESSEFWSKGYFQLSNT